MIDANVLINESASARNCAPAPQTAIATGFSRAWATILTPT